MPAITVKKVVILLAHSIIELSLDLKYYRMRLLVTRSNNNGINDIMVNSFNLIVFYQNRHHLFHIAAETELLKDIQRSIGNYFHITIDNFVVEVYDERYKLYIVLDKYYLSELRSDAYFVENNSVEARVRSRQQPSFNTKSETDQLPASIDEGLNVQPNHGIIWLDKYIGDSTDYQMLKSRFNNIIQLNELNSKSSRDDDTDIDNIDRLIRNVPDKYLMLDPWKHPSLYAFSDIPPCIEFISRISELERTIFFITSDTLGRTIIPQIYDNVHIHSIYILISGIVRDLSWVMNYPDKLNVFGHDSDLFSRLARDIAEYYTEKASIDKHNPTACLSFLKWATMLYKKADENDGEPLSSHQLKSIEKLIQKSESLISSREDFGVEETSQH